MARRDRSRAGGGEPGPCTTRRQLLAGLGITLLGHSRAAADASPVIAAAASLRPALEAIVPGFERATGSKLRVSYGATGSLVRQIELGAPFELFLSADTESVARLVQGGFTDGAGRALVRGRIVLAARIASPVAIDAAGAGLALALDRDLVRRFAIANPELAPYGRAAREAMTRAGLWPRLKDRLAVAENIGQAAQFVASGGAEAGIVALSSALSPELRDKIRFAVIAEDWHSPIEQHMAVLKRAGSVARAFTEHLRGPVAREAFEKAGFAVP